MKFNSFSNRRQFKRLFRTRAHRWKISIPEKEISTGQLTSLSPTGVSMRVPRWANLVQEQKLGFQLSLEDSKLYDCAGKIVWIKEKADDQMIEVGVRFSKVPSGLFEKIAELCKAQEATTKVPNNLTPRTFRKSIPKLGLEHRSSHLGFKQGILIVLFFGVIGLATHLANRKNQEEGLRQLASQPTTVIESTAVPLEKPQKFTGKRRRPANPRNF